MDFPLYLQPKIYIFARYPNRSRAKNISLRCRDKLSIPKDASWTTEAGSGSRHPVLLPVQVLCDRAPHRAGGDVLLPLAHVGALLQGGAAALPEVPAAVGVPRLQAQPAAVTKERGGGGGDTCMVTKTSLLITGLGEKEKLPT